MTMKLIQTRSTAAFLVVLVGSFTPIQAKANYVPYPTQQQLRKLQVTAFNCSRENSQEACKRTRDSADPLMDHPRLSVICKDVLWELIQVSQPAPTNSFQRRDNIDKPARRLTLVCKDPTKPEKPETPPGGGLMPSQT